MIARPTKHTLLHAIRTNRAEDVHLALGISRDQLVRWCRENGIEPPAVKHPGGARKGEQFGGRKSARPDFETWSKLCQEHPPHELQEQFGVSYWTVWSWCKHYGVPMPGARVRPPADAGARPTEPDPEPEPAPPASTTAIDLAVPRMAAVPRLQYWLQPNHGADLEAGTPW